MIQTIHSNTETSYMMLVYCSIIGLLYISPQAYKKNIIPHGRPFFRLSVLMSFYNISSEADIVP